MFQALVITLREGFEAFLLVSIIYAYLIRTGKKEFISAVNWGVLLSFLASALFGFLLQSTTSQPFWEGLLGIVAAVFVTTLVVQMWLQGRHMKTQIETKMGNIASASSTRMWWGIFIFTVFMIAREGMETALMLIQVPQKNIFAGIVLGLAATGVFCLLWVKFSKLINVKLFFQVTGVFLLLFMVQILIYSFHEFSEAGMLPNSEAFHAATEPYSPDGLYGKWFSVVTVGICAFWLVFAWLKDRLQRSHAS